VLARARNAHAQTPPSHTRALCVQELQPFILGIQTPWQKEMFRRFGKARTRDMYRWCTTVGRAR